MKELLMEGERGPRGGTAFRKDPTVVVGSVHPDAGVDLGMLEEFTKIVSRESFICDTGIGLLCSRGLGLGCQTECDSTTTNRQILDRAILTLKEGKIMPLRLKTSKD
jgi:hypothetical protein